jgi:hypothetical protein
MIHVDNLITESLEYGHVERATKAALLVFLSYHATCPRCPNVASSGSEIERAWWGHPVTHTDANGPACYEHAALDAQPIENWRAFLFADVARSLGGYDLDDAGREAIYNTEERRPGLRSLALRAALRAYAARWGDDENVASYSSETPARAERIGLCVYALIANDPRVRPAEVVDAFAAYRRLRWPKGGDPCPDPYCNGVVVSVSTGTRIRGEDPMIFCPVHKAEADRRASLTPDERRAEDEANKVRLREKVRGLMRRQKAEREVAKVRAVLGGAVDESDGKVVT